MGMKKFQPSFKTGQTDGISSSSMGLSPIFLARRCTKNATLRKYRTAGMMATPTMVRYGIWVHWLMMNAPAPMIGGMSWPPVDAAASTAPAKIWRKTPPASSGGW